MSQPEPPTTPPSRTECQDALLIHMLQLCWIPLPAVGGLLVPLVLWMLRKDRSPYLEETGREVVNFAISMLLYMAIAAATLIVPICGWVVGFLALILLSIIWIILPIVAGLEAGKGEIYRYPLNLNLIR